MSRILIYVLLVCLSASTAYPGSKPTRLGDSYPAIARHLSGLDVLAWDGCTEPRADPAGWIVRCSYRQFDGESVSKHGKWFTIKDGKVIRVDDLEAHPVTLSGS